MIHISDDDRRRAFVVWLRTGRLPPVPREDGLDLTFNPWHATVEFARGAAEGLSDTAAGASRGTYSLLTTNPATTALDAGRAIAHTIDAAVAAEDVPARIRISRAADAIAHASAHDLGRAAGSAVGNVALAVGPGATLSKVSALRRLRAAGPSGVVLDPMEVGWAKEIRVQTVPQSVIYAFVRGMLRGTMSLREFVKHSFAIYANDDRPSLETFGGWAVRTPRQP